MADTTLMPFFESDDQLYTCADLLFDRIQKRHPNAARSLLRSRLLIRLNCRQPMAAITINARRAPLRTSFGASSLRPDLDIGLKADTLHHILLGELTLSKAMGRGALQVKGPVWKVLTLADLFYQSQTIYPEVLREQGLLG